jgi:hypothetical protein
MKVKDIIIGEYYRLKDNPNYGYFKALKILKPKQFPNDKNYIVIQGEHTINKNDNFGFYRYFKPIDLIKQ